jgi:hypothetical protein
MSSFEFSIDGLDALKASMAAAVPKIREGASKALYAFAEEVMTASKAIVPVETGNLMSTGHVGKQQSPGVKEGFVYQEGDELIIDVGYGDDAIGYALYVHENMFPGVNWTRPGSGPKFLESPFNERVDQLPGRIKNAVNYAMKS